MRKKVQDYYQRLIYEDIKRPRYLLLRKIFPWIILSFFILQVVYYFVFFHNRIWRRIGMIMFFHKEQMLLVRPKTVMFMYDYFLSFILYLFFIFVFSILAFIAFDSSQRSHLIRKLGENQKEIVFEEDEEED